MDDEKLLGVEDDLIDGEEEDDDDVDDEEEPDEEEKQKIEQLALNSNFDPGLLVDCWEEAAAVTTTTTNSSAANSLPDTNSSEHTKLSGSNATIPARGSSGRRRSRRRRGSTNARSMHRTDSGLAVAPAAASATSAEDDAAWDDFDKAQQSILLSTMTRTPPPPPNFGDSSNNNVDTNAGGIQEPDAEVLEAPNAEPLPPFETTATGTGVLQQPPSAGPSSAAAVVAAPLPSLSASGATVQGPFFPGISAGMDSASLIPLAFNAIAAGVDLSSFINAPSASNSAATSSGSITPPIPNPLAPSSSTKSAESTLSKAPQVHPQQATVSSAASAAPTPAPKKPPPTNNKKRSSGGRRGKSSSRSQRQQQSGTNNNGEEEEDPPFMLFDAPVELRHNFIQSQRSHGLPVLHDNNSFHFDRSTQATAAAAVAAAPGVAAVGSTNATFAPTFANMAAFHHTMPRLADARHGEDTAGSKRIKNAKEQKRAQRITELIEQLRVRMEKGGWKVGIKSKLHTLSSCSDYVKHLVQTTKEKEAAVEATRSDLETKRRKIEEEKSAQDPSEPESTTSSLTVSSGSRSTNKKIHGRSGNNDIDAKNTAEEAEAEETTSDKKPPAVESSKVACDSAEKASEESDVSPNKKRKLSSHESNSDEYFSSIENDDSGKKLRSNGVGQNVSIGPISNVSDITDNNKYSKSSSSSSEENTTSATPGDANAVSRKDGDGDPSAQNTVCSDAAVAETSDPRDHSHDSSTSRGNSEERGVSIQTITTTTSTHRKRKLQDLSTPGGTKTKRDATSLESSFRLDYEEVFLKSNVPQIIASTTGRIVAHNDMFLRATKLHRKQVERLTIFSLVQTAMLSNLFELVAASLKDQQEPSTPDAAAVAASTSATPLQDYSTMTLPCVPFHKDRPSLYMTITLMTDEDVRKRCFHCVFTDCAPGAKGSVGSVTKQLLETLFQPISSNGSDAQSSSATSSRGESSRTDTKSSGGGRTSITTQSEDKQQKQEAKKGDDAT